MQHFPIFVNLRGERVTLSGGGEAALAKLRLLLKTEGDIHVFAAEPHADLETLADEGRLTLHRRAARAGDFTGSRLAYGANEDHAEDTRIKALAEAEGALVNIVDDLHNSQFITPAIVDRDPVTVAIGTEGAAPVLARAIKRDLEERLPSSLGLLTRIGKAFRTAADALPMGKKRRDFWADYYFNEGPKALAKGEESAREALDALLTRHLSEAPEPGEVAFVGAGPGDPEMLTLAARRALDEAEVIIHDGLVSPEILELARREALMIDVSKKGFGKSTPQEAINALIVGHALKGEKVVRLKAGDPGVYGRLDEELDALAPHGIATRILPGITAASAAAASIGQSLTKRGRNSDLRFLTGHDTKGFTEQDWHALAAPGAVAAIYMAKKGARFLQGRLMMHGASPATDVTVVENASRPDTRILHTTLAALPETVEGLSGPAVLLYGLAPRDAATELKLKAAQ
ncbi:siroheme synthase CysG [Vannielia litorea]|uniref:siroheme synthase CysG n=1 Tax=Vannielia litorea TaxID=1217970 RepID=UPI001C93E0AD|nr:siroheme synthase CysG [Vannielia litorea]MBY6047694.1 siroheme synthase CysG [Vannielia litorea]MBY6075108.1 siroheme synthase CysG [Vannielia litorea]